LAHSKYRDLAPMTSNRLVESFWHLVKNNRAERITVKMIVEEAHCSRGSFYYHFEDMNSMISSVAENELVLSGIIPRTLHAILMGEYELLKAPQNDFHVKRIQLLANQSAPDTLSRALDAANNAIWSHLLCQDSEGLAEEASFLIAFYTAGLKASFGLQLPHPGSPDNDSFLESDTLREATIATVRQICKAQGVTGNSFIKRLEKLKDAGWVPSDL